MEENLQNEQVVEEPIKVEEKEEPDIDELLKKAKKKGRKQGAWITIGIVVGIALIVLVIRVISMIANGTLLAAILGNFGGSIFDMDVIDKTNEVYRIIETTYLDEIDKEKLQEGLIKGMVEGLEDPYSVYYNKEEFAEMMEDSSGTFEGIGAYLSQDPDTMEIKVVRPIRNSPAEAEGILSEDIIVEVDGENISGQDINLVVSKIKGPQGSKVNIGVFRKGEMLYFDITRAKVEAESVTWEMLEDNIGYIIISEFADATGQQFTEGYDRLLSEGMTSLIIDLRSNGGGYVDTSVEVADRLVKEGVIVSVVDRHGLSYTYEDAGDDKYTEIPIVVLVDGNTASASEILTGCLKDYGLATIIGTQTFGKGITQDVIPLEDGTGVKITSANYYSPDGINIHGVGIEPDIVVEWDYEKYVEDGTDNQLEAAIDYLTKLQ